MGTPLFTAGDVVELDLEGVATTALVLLVISFVTLAFVYGLNRRLWMWK
jgi:hypothetical protein